MGANNALDIAEPNYAPVHRSRSLRDPGGGVPRTLTDGRLWRLEQEGVPPLPPARLSN